MRKILLYFILVVILFSGFNQIREIWNNNEENVGGTFTEVKEGILGWYEKATSSSKALKEELNEKISSATEKYESIKSDLETTTEKILEKKKQLENTLKEIEEAKNALNELLDQNPELAEEGADTEGEATEEGDSEEAPVTEEG